MAGLAANKRFQNHQLASMTSPSGGAGLEPLLEPGVGRADNKWSPCLSPALGFLKVAYPSLTTLRAMSKPVFNRSINSSGDWIIRSSLLLFFADDEGRVASLNRSLVVVFGLDCTRGFFFLVFRTDFRISFVVVLNRRLLRGYEWAGIVSDTFIKPCFMQKMLSDFCHSRWHFKSRRRRFPIVKVCVALVGNIVSPHDLVRGRETTLLK